MEITRINLPISNDIRMKNVQDGSEDGLWVAAGPTTAIREAVEAGGVWIFTRRGGPKAVLVERVVKVGDGLAIVPVEPDFDKASKTTTNKVEDMTAAQLKAALAKLEGNTSTTSTTGNGAKVTSSGKTRSNSAGTTGRGKAASKATEVTKSAPAAAAVADVDDDDLAELLV